MLSFKRLTVGNRIQSRDLIGILLALAVGIVGQLILSDPLKLLLSRDLPLLSLQDWPGSQFTREPTVREGRPWREKRAFIQSIVMIKNKTSIAAATQTVFWYADVKQATVEWNRHKVEPYFDFPTVASNTSSDKPASLLLCSTPQPDIQGICVYRAYWEHWYTEVEFYGAQSEDFRLSEMQKLTDRVDQLLMAAPDKPCQGFFCIGTNR